MVRVEVLDGSGRSIIRPYASDKCMRGKREDQRIGLMVLNAMFSKAKDMV